MKLASEIEGSSHTVDFVTTKEDLSHSPLWNPDLAPTPLDRRTWSTYNIAALWIGMSVVITTYTLASGMMTQGMTWWQAMVTILLGNTIVLIPMILNAHAGTKYGISFPVLCRAAFGVKGANVPALLRAVVACGWFGIQTWIAALALNTLFTAAWPGWTSVARRHRDRLRALLAAAGGDHRRRHRGHQDARQLRGAGAHHRQHRAAVLGHPARRRTRTHPRRVVAPPGRRREGRVVLGDLPAGAHGGRRLLGDAEPEHPRLHALRAQPEVAGARPGARPAHDDDGVRLHRRRGDERDDRDLRKAGVGSGRARDEDRRHGGDHLRRAGGARGAAAHEHGGERRVAVERLLEPQARSGSAT